MKTDPVDFLLSGACIATILVTALAVVGFLLTPLTRRGLGDYYVVADFLLLLLIYGLFSAVAVRTLLKFRAVAAGEYPMTSPVFTYWKLLTILYRLGQCALLPFTPVFLKPVIEGLFGARIGSDVALGGTIDDPYMVSIGNGAVLGNASLVSANVITNGKITVGRVSIGAGATVGANVIVLPGCEIGADAVVIAGALVMPGTKIPAGETWRGSPARKWL